MNIGKIQYLYQLNIMSYYSPKIRIFFESISVEKIMKNLEVLIEDIVPEDDWEDVHIGTFFTSFGDRCIMPYEDCREDLTLIVYPKKGEIKEYRLNKKSDFLSNNHQNPDPIVIRSILEAVCLHPTITKEKIWLPGWNGFGAPNKIGGTFLYKTNPFEPITKYLGFQELMNPPKD